MSAATRRAPRSFLNARRELGPFGPDRDFPGLQLFDLLARLARRVSGLGALGLFGLSAPKAGAGGLAGVQFGLRAGPGCALAMGGPHPGARSAGRRRRDDGGGGLSGARRFLGDPVDRPGRHGHFLPARRRAAGRCVWRRFGQAGVGTLALPWGGYPHAVGRRRPGHRRFRPPLARLSLAGAVGDDR